MIFSGRLQRDPNTSQVWYSNDFNSGVLLSLLRGTSQDKKCLGQKMSRTKNVPTLQWDQNTGQFTPFSIQYGLIRTNFY